MWHEAMHPMGWFGWAGHGVGLILMLLFWALVIAAVVYLVRGLSGRGARPDSAETALQVLERRYAEGAIDGQEFRSKRAELTREPPQSS